jgi:hypothetical protein
MDPDKAFVLLTDQIEKDEWQEAAETAENLLVWLQKEGFPPRITGRTTVDRIIAESTCRAVAAWQVA